MRLLDLYCCQGGASEGYEEAGFDVYGVDIDPQPRYPFMFVQMDALDAMQALLAGGSITFKDSHGNRETVTLDDFYAIHASPPCQAHTKAWKLNKREHPKLIAPTRDLLLQSKLPYVIENVEEAAVELIRPERLCGASFGIDTYRHRLFETNWSLFTPPHLTHKARTTKMGRAPVDGEYMHIVGNFSGVDKARQVMGMSWASRDGLREAIPPAYAKFIGLQLWNVADEFARLADQAKARGEFCLPSHDPVHP